VVGAIRQYRDGKRCSTPNNRRQSQLADRLSGATEWIASRAETRKLPIGYFGASTGAAAALISETMHSGKVHAIVSRGGRPDLAGRALVRHFGDKG
jgi:hypothetical protein